MQKSVQARKNRIISTMNEQFQSDCPFSKWTEIHDGGIIMCGITTDLYELFNKRIKTR